MEAMNVEQRLEGLERLNGITGPAICPDPTGEGSAWQGEVVRITDPHPWSIPSDGEVELKDCDIIMSSDRYWHSLVGQFRKGHNWAGSTVDEARAACGNRGLKFFRKYPVPAEPAPGSDAEHPPEGYVLVPNGSGEKIGSDWISWSWGKGPWESLDPRTPGKRHASYHYPMARPIPANEGDSQKEVSELRATVERLTAELDTTKRLLAESLVERDRLKNLHDARKVRIDGFRDVLREHLGGLV